MFPKSARLKAAAPAARRKAAVTRKKNLALKLKQARQETATVNKAKGNVTTFKISDLPSALPPAKKKYTPRSRTTPAFDQVQLARELLAILAQVLK